MALITTTAPTVNATGITAPSYADILAFLTSKYQSIFGSDVYLGPDSQDGQFLAVIASAINDVNAVAISIYNAFSPATAVGTGLSSVVKINGLQRQQGTYSTVDLTITGTPGTKIVNGVVSDGTNQWDLPASVTLPSSGQITVTATSEVPGSLLAAKNTVTQIVTPVLGWKSVTNPSASAPGTDTESDAALRQRQAVSTALPSLSIIDGLTGAVKGISGVTRIAIVENATDSTDSNNIPAHSLAMVVEGGDAQAIGQMIELKKSPGVGTYGSTTVSAVTINGPNIDIHFSRPTPVPVTVQVNLTALSNYTDDIGNEIANAVATYINTLPIGQKCMLGRVYTYANLNGGPDSLTYELNSLTLNGASADVAIAFNQSASCSASDVVITVA